MTFQRFTRFDPIIFARVLDGHVTLRRTSIACRYIVTRPVVLEDEDFQVHDIMRLPPHSRPVDEGCPVGRPSGLVLAVREMFKLGEPIQPLQRRRQVFRRRASDGREN